MPSDVTKPACVVLPDALGLDTLGFSGHSGQRGAHVCFALRSKSLSSAPPALSPFRYILITLMAVSGAITLDSGLWYVIRDRQPISALALVMAGSWIPWSFFGLVGLYAMVRMGSPPSTDDLPMNLAKVVGATVMRLEASLNYPNRLRSPIGW